VSASQDDLDRLASRPVDADGVSAVTLGTVAWAIAFMILVVFFRDDLAAADASWWIWVCLVGMALGLVGMFYVMRRREVYRRHEAEHRGEESAP